MNKIFEQCTVDGELTPELMKRKQELDQSLEIELDKIEQNKSLTWVAKQKQSTDLQQEYDDIWEQELTDAGYVVRPMFESLTKLCEDISNKALIATGLVDQEVSSVEIIRQDCDTIQDERELRFYAMQCQAGVLKVLRDSGAHVLVNDAPVAIDIANGGGGEFMSDFNKERLTRFNIKKVFDLTLRAGAGFVDFSNILLGETRLVDADGNPDEVTFRAVRTIAACYKRAFERILLPEVVAARQEAELERFKNDLEATDVAPADTTVTGYWSILGWLTKNVRQIKAIIPERGDFLNTFLSYNMEAEEGVGYVVHEDGITSGGFVNQFTYMFLVSFTKRIKLPTAVRSWLSGFGSQVKNPMSCNKLAMTLIHNYGFTFGLTDQEAVAETCLAEATSDADKKEFFKGYGDGAEELAAKIGYTIPTDAPEEKHELDLNFPHPEDQIDSETDAAFEPGIPDAFAD